MKGLGIALLLVGLVVGLFAMTMDVSVSTEAQTIGGVEMPSQRVNNLGLMDERRNYLIIAGFLMTGGLVLTVLGYQRGDIGTAQPVPAPLRKCPFCAEGIQPEAVVCRFCGRDLPDTASEVIDSGALTLPGPVKEALVDLRWLYVDWLGLEDDESFWVADERAAQRAEVLASLKRIGRLVAAKDSTVKWNLARAIREEFPRLVDDAELNECVVRFEDEESGGPA